MDAVLNKDWATVEHWLSMLDGFTRGGGPVGPGGSDGRAVYKALELRCPQKLALAMIQAASASSLEYRTARGNTVLHMAMSRGLTYVDAVLHKAPGLLHQGDVHGMQPLHKSLYTSKLALTKKLLDHGADIEAANMYGCTPLIVAAEAGNVAGVEELVRRGASLDRTTTRGATACHVACAHAVDDTAGKYVAVVERILDLDLGSSFADLADMQGLTPLHYAALAGNVDVMKAVLHRARAPHAVAVLDRMGRTPLHLAALSRQSEAVRFLLSVQPAAADVRDSRGMDALDMALGRGGHGGRVSMRAYTGLVAEARSPRMLRWYLDRDFTGRRSLESIELLVDAAVARGVSFDDIATRLERCPVTLEHCMVFLVRATLLVRDMTPGEWSRVPTSPAEMHLALPAALDRSYDSAWETVKRMCPQKKYFLEVSLKVLARKVPGPVAEHIAVLAVL